MSDDTKECMWCGEEIKAKAKLCRFCNREQTAPAEPEAERVLYSGAVLYPIGQLVTDLVLCLFCIGFFTLPLHVIEHSGRKVRVTTKRVQLSSGILTKRIDVMDLYRVQDLSYEESWGRGTVVLLSSDPTTPTLRLKIPRARHVFEKLQGAVQAARAQAGVVLREQM